MPQDDILHLLNQQFLVGKRFHHEIQQKSPLISYLKHASVHSIGRDEPFPKQLLLHHVLLPVQSYILRPEWLLHYHQDQIVWLQQTFCLKNARNFLP